MKKFKKETSEIYKMLNTLIKENKIRFTFYDNELVPLEPISVIENKSTGIIEINFRDIVKEHLEELKELISIKE